MGSLDGQPDGKLSARPVKTKPKLPANQRAASEKMSQAKSCCVHFKQPDLGPPTGGYPNQIVIVERSPAHIVPLPRLHYLIVNLSHGGKYL